MPCPQSANRDPIKERDDDTYAVELPKKLSQVCLPLPDIMC